MVKSSFYFMVLFPIIVFSQIISFEPDIDTLKIGGACTPPQISASINDSNPDQDSIFISPGWNTNIFSKSQSYTSVVFIIKTSGSDFDYELNICHKDQISFSDTLVPFDTTFEFEAREFFFKLVVLNNGTAVDSLEKLFITEIGVNIENLTFHNISPDETYLLSCYPNPFNPELFIEFKSPVNEYVHISIFNSLGQEIGELYEGLNHGETGKLNWNANNLCTGNYYILFKSNGHIKSQKVLLLK